MNRRELLLSTAAAALTAAGAAAGAEASATPSPEDCVAVVIGGRVVKVRGTGPLTITPCPACKLEGRLRITVSGGRKPLAARTTDEWCCESLERHGPAGTFRILFDPACRWTVQERTCGHADCVGFRPRGHEPKALAGRRSLARAAELIEFPNDGWWVRARAALIDVPGTEGSA